MGSYRAAVIGCGRIGGDCGLLNMGSSRLESHAEAYKAWGSTHLVAGCDPDEDSRLRFGEKWGITRLYADYREMLEREDLGIVSICTPVSNHAEIMTDLFASKTIQGILLEKPVAIDVSEATKMIEDAQISSATIAVNYSRRYLSSYKEVYDMVRSGALGRIQHVRGLYTKGVVNNGSHFIDLLRFFFGEPESLRVFPGASTHTGSFRLNSECNNKKDPTLNFSVTYPEGFEAWGVGLDHSSFNVFDIDIIGTEGRVVFTDLGHRRLFYRREKTKAQYGFRQLAPEPEISSTDLSGATREAVKNLTESIESGRSPRCTLQDGRAAIALSLELANMFANEMWSDREVPTLETL